MSKRKRGMSLEEKRQTMLEIITQAVSGSRPRVRARGALGPGRGAESVAA